MNIENITPVRDLCLVKLPDETEQLTRQMENGIHFSTLDEVKYHPTQGILYIDSFPSKETLYPFNEVDWYMLFGKEPLKKGTQVFFSKLHWQTAKDAAFDFDHERDKGLGTESDVLAICVPNDGYYMLMPYSFFYMAIHEENIIMLNDYLLCEPILKEKPTGLMADTQIDSYIHNCAKVSCGNSKYPEGTIIVTLPHCDIYLEEALNHPVYKKESFIIESENVIATIMENKIIPGTGRLLIKPIPAEQEQENGLTNLASELQKLNTATVVSVGENCATGCKEGDTILYARNSGQKVPPFKGVDLELEIIDDRKDNSKVFAIIQTI